MSPPGRPEAEYRNAQREATPMRARYAAPFAPSFPIRSLEDIRRLEETPLAEALTVRRMR
jgi:hypothetical protein